MKSILIIISLLFYYFSVVSQEVEKTTPRIDFSVSKISDGSRILAAKLFVIKNRISYPVISVPIIFDAGERQVEIKTNPNGIAYLVIAAKTQLQLNDEGFINFSATFNGNDTLESITDEKLIKDVFIGLSLIEIDSVRTISVTLKTLNNKGDTIPVSGETVNLYVPRMINLLKIGEEATDDDGVFSIEFPNDLPGSPDSTITVIAKIEEHEQYANVEVKEVARWGIPIIHRIPESHRALWTEIAPVWMIITLTIMLVGVWGHYIFVIIQLILIKLESKKQKV